MALIAIILLATPAECPWGLDGKHVGLDCDECHFSDDFQDAEPACGSCHAPLGAPHLAPGAMDCGACHRTDGTVAFDHARSGFELAGPHRTLRCDRCHTTPDFARVGTAGGCVGCHLDPHRGGAGRECDQCHDGRSWFAVRYDHDMTGFSLTGRHLAVPCRECHRGGRFVGQPDACVFCHGDERPASHRFPGAHDCAACHQPSGFRVPVFQHDPPLATAGPHARVAQDCGRCHASGAPLDGDDCVRCHRADLSARHRAFLADGDGLAADCTDCHDRSAPWSAPTFFRHPPEILVGGHATLPCSSCHPLPATIKAGAEMCRACHIRHQPRRGHPTGTDCVDCHTPAGWFPSTNR